VLIKAAIKLAFFRLVEYLEPQHLWVWLQAQNGQKQRTFSLETHQSILVLRNEGYSMREIAKKLKIRYNAVYYSLHRTAQTVSNQNRKRSGRPGTQLSKRTSTLECLVWETDTSQVFNWKLH
jgi:transposase